MQRLRTAPCPQALRSVRDAWHAHDPSSEETAHTDSRVQHQDLDACDGHNSSSSGSGGGPFSSFTRSPHRLVVRDLFGAQETAFEPLRLHLKPVSEGEEELQPTSSDN